jgi:acyl dehydratase
MRFLDEIRIGERVVIGSHTFTAAAIKAFAARYDPQPFHLDEAAAARSHFGALCASGWHTAGVWMRLVVDHRRAESEARRARGEPVARTGVSPGFRNLKWPKPVYAGDTITYATEVIATRPLLSRPGWGLLTSRNTGTNPAGELVLSFEGAVFLEMAPA